jgi:type IX secretion system PorP/SprF family membrane protein
MQKILLCTLLLLAAGKVKSQDFHLSMYDAAPLFLNGSMTGVFEGKWRVHAQYRTQWKSVNYKPYTTALISFDMPYKKWGFGGQVANFRAGAGNYNALQILGSAAYTLPIDNDHRHNLSFGVQAGITQKSIVNQLLTFDNQYTTVNGGSFDNGLPNAESFQGQSLIVPVTNIGALYYYARQQSKLNPFIGISAFNIVAPQESFLERDSRLPMRVYVHAGTRINITELLYLLPKVLVMHQHKFNEQTYALDAGYYLKSPELYLLGGLIYRSKDATVFSIGARKDNFIAKIAYDINTSSLSLTSTGRGGFELSFTYMKQTPRRKQVSKICPRL